MTTIFDIRHYSHAQIVDALTCPVNRHMTRVEHDCNDQDLYENPEWLLAHYVKHGGAKAFAKRRKEFERQVFTEDDIEYII